MMLKPQIATGPCEAEGPNETDAVSATVYHFKSAEVSRVRLWPRSGNEFLRFSLWHPLVSSQSFLQSSGLGDAVTQEMEAHGCSSEFLPESLAATQWPDRIELFVPTSLVQSFLNSMTEQLNAFREHAIIDSAVRNSFAKQKTYIAAISLATQVKTPADIYALEEVVDGAQDERLKYALRKEIAQIVSFSSENGRNSVAANFAAYVLGTSDPAFYDSALVFQRHGIPSKELVALSMRRTSRAESSVSELLAEYLSNVERDYPFVSYSLSV